MRNLIFITMLCLFSVEAFSQAGGQANENRKKGKGLQVRNDKQVARKVSKDEAAIDSTKGSEKGQKVGVDRRKSGQKNREVKEMKANVMNTASVDSTKGFSKGKKVGFDRRKGGQKIANDNMKRSNDQPKDSLAKSKKGGKKQEKMYEKEKKQNAKNQPKPVK